MRDETRKSATQKALSFGEGWVRLSSVNEEKQPGVYEVEFDGENNSSGIYFYVMKTGNPSTGSGQSFIDTKKLVLMK